MAEQYIGYNNSGIINLEDNFTGAKMLDKFSRIKDGRMLKPLDLVENIPYSHRYAYDEFNLMIGDTYFMIPPEFISVSSESTSQSIVTLRQENTQKMKSGYHKRTIFIDLVFNGMDQLNGYAVDGPEGTYYVDGLRQLLAQFKCTPFLPISNELINGMYGIFTVVLQAITMETMQGYPNVMIAHITLQEINMFPYILMPDVCFKYMIDWDLFRFYYQRLLTEKHEYKKLQSLPTNKEHNRFKISILDESVFSSDEATKYNMLDIICDKDIVKKKDDGSFDTTNFTMWVDSDTSDAVIASFQCGYSNLLTNIQLSDSGSPTAQFMGGMDTVYNIIFETTDYGVVQSLEQCRITNDLLTRSNIKLNSLGFVKLESELVEFTGSLFVMVDTVTTSTVPGFPGLYNVQMSCVAYDIAQSEREDLHGFMPFDCNHSGKCGYYNSDSGQYESDYVHEEQAIDQSMNGLSVKVKQDNYAEWKIRSTMEVYPDLRLPKYDEVDSVITKIRAFRSANGLTQLPYDSYPKAPAMMLHGQHPDNNISFEMEDNGAIIDNTSISDTDSEYGIYVDPDFYVFYPASYESFLKDDPDVYSSYSPNQRSSYVKRKTVEKTPNYGEGSTNSSLIEQFIALAKSFIGHSYVWGAEGEISDSAGKCFDCSGFVTYLLKEIGVMPASQSRFVVSSMPKSDLFIEVPWDQMQRGDILCNAELSHVVIYEGDNTVVHASNSSPYPKGGVKESTLYFSGGRCLRPKAFGEIGDAGEESPTTSGNSNMETIWNILKSYGCSDVCAAGIIGNMGRETGGTFDPRIVQGGSRSDTIPSSGGYGLVQYTYSGYKTGLKKWCDSNGVGVNTNEGQIGYLMSLISGTDYFAKMNSTSDVSEATKLFQDEFEKPGVKAFDERVKYAQLAYNQFKGTGGSTDTSGSTENVLTTSEFDSICRVVMAETKGEPSDAEKAVAQVIYDRLTHSTKKFGGLSNILNSSDQFKAPYQGELNATVEDNVKSVFCENSKYWPTYKAWYFLTPEDTNATYKKRDTDYDRLGEVGLHTFWGSETSGSDIKYTISDTAGTGDASSNSVKTVYEIEHDAITIKNIKKFGQPVFIKTDAILYDNNWFPWSNKEGEIAQDNLNSTENIFNTSFCDEVQYSGRGKLVRAFPAYLFCILDDDAQWYNGNKLWTNFYVYHSVVDIAVHGTNDMPTETATILITNSYHNLDRTQGGLSSYSLKNDDAYGSFQQFWYSWTGTMIFGFGPKLTDKLIKLHQIIYNHAKLRNGTRVHLRMGYGSDPLSLAPMINGHISDVSLGDQISIVVTSDGHELIQHITSSSEKDTNNGFLGLFGAFENQESSNIISEVLCKRQSWVTHLMRETFEGSKYSIEHFGLYFNKDVMGMIGEYVLQSTGDGAGAGSEIGQDVGETVGLGIPIISDVTGFIGYTVGGLIGGVGGLVGGIFKGAGDLISDIWDGNQEQYDILKNVYKANYKRQHYIYTTALLGIDSEQNVVFNKYNMTPWDVFQICTQQVPEYILKVGYHQFDSRLYFGLPGWMEKYRYDYLNGKAYEECKTAAQVHFIDSMDCIIDDQIKVTSKYSNTNIKVMYTRGSSTVSTKTIHSDDTIDFSKQKTTILDTPITQDALGPDIIYEFLGYNIGEESARRVGISNLLYGWQQQYQGQLILLGHPGLKPNDIMMLNDTYASLYGICTVREVVHSFNTSTGFTTSVTPGMISYSTDENSGMIETVNNYLMVLNCFSSYTMVRKASRNNYEKNLAAASDMEILRDKLVAAATRQANINFAGNVVMNGVSIAVAANAGHKMFKFGKGLYNLVKSKEILDVFKTGYTAVKTAKTGITGTLAAIKAGSIATGTAAGGLPGLVMAALWVVVDVLLNELFEWLSNRNVCVLLPLWWEGYPFVSGVKNGENILLVDSSRPTDENDGSASTDVEDE